VVAATNRVLLERIAENLFREDLYYRLNVIHLVIPPLRERREDVEPLLTHFLQVFSEKYGTEAPGFSPDALALLRDYDWPGNVRELKNVAERLIVRGRGGLVQPDDLPAGIPTRGRTAATPATTAGVAVTGSARSSELFDRIVTRRESFWTAVYAPFMARDLTRDDVRSLVSAGLQHTRGNYKMLIELFNMAPTDYKRFLNFLRKHQCHMPFQQFRTSESLRPITEENAQAIA
jgi:DNA-binding NtrC family response regulator